MKIRLLIGFSLLLLAGMDAAAQDWYLRRYEVDLNLGAVAFYGDIGEKEQPLANMFNGFRPALGLTPRFRVSPAWAVSLDLGYLVFAGKDDVEGAHGRVYTFNSHAFQHFARVEYLLLGTGTGRQGASVNKRGMVKRSDFLQVYILGGAGGILTKAKVKDTRNHLEEPLSNPGYYPGFRYAAGFPLGGGVRVNPSIMWGIGMELSYNFTLSDKLDGYQSAASTANDSYYLLQLKAVLRIRNDRKMRPHLRKYYPDDPSY